MSVEKFLYNMKIEFVKQLNRESGYNKNEIIGMFDIAFTHAYLIQIRTEENSFNNLSYPFDQGDEPK